jgi:hypothetical protein
MRTHLFIGAWLLTVASYARAADIDTITLTAAGPSKTIPTDAAFYLAGTADADTTRIQVLIVRTGSDIVWRYPHGESCIALASKLDKFVNPGDPTQLPAISPGDTTAREVWVAGDEDWKVRALAPWAPVDGKLDFKILVDKDTEFFSAGYSYCFFVYQLQTKRTKDLKLGTEILQAIQAYFDGDKDFSRVDKAIGNLPDGPDKQTLKDKTPRFKDTAAKLIVGVNRAAAVLARWGDAIGPSTVPGYVGIDKPLGHAMAILLVKNHKLASAKDGFVFDNGKQRPVKAFSFDANGKLGVAATSAGVQPWSSETALSDYKIPGTTVSLRELYELSQRRLPFGKDDYVAPAALLAKLRLLFTARAAAFTTEQDKVFTDAHDALSSLDAAVQAIHQIHTQKTRPPPGSDADILWSLGDWLASDVEAHCDVDVERAWGVEATPCIPDKKGWESYAVPQAFPLHRLVEALDSFHDAQKAWVSDIPGLPRTVEVTRSLTQPFGARVQVTEDVWVFSYLSPVVGYALAAPQRGGSESLELHYFAVQLHLRPNPSQQPRLDLRGIAFELGASPGIGSFGPDNRFRGLSNISPVFVGLAVHLLPYTSVSAGCLFMEKRSSTLAQETYATFATPYVGLSVDLNLPELIRSQTSKTSTTTSAPAK